MSALTDLLTGIAEAIRSKTGGTELIRALDFPAVIRGISGGGASMVTTTIPDEAVAEWGITSLTIPELIGAKYFIIQGNAFDEMQLNSATDPFWEAGKIIQAIYLNGTVIVTALYTPGTQSKKLYVATGIDTTFSFDEGTGTISTPDAMFSRLYGDTSTTGSAYTVYRIG